MRRRDFLVTAGAAACTFGASAQQTERTNIVGALMGWSDEDAEYRGWLAAFEDELTKLATMDRRTFRIAPRWTRGEPGKARMLAAELVATKPDVIFASTTPVIAALHAETATIPIVFAVVSDPVGAKFVNSFSRPGGNVTGFVQTEGRLGGKWLALLKEAAPRLTHVAILFNPDTAAGHGAFYLTSFEEEARSLGIEGTQAPCRTKEEIVSVIARLGAERGGLVLMDDSGVAAHRAVILAEASRAKVPIISPESDDAADGALLAYSTDFAALCRNAAGYVDRILRGDRPGDLPVQSPTQYNLSINLKTAAMLGLEMPQTLLASAHDVIE